MKRYLDFLAFAVIALIVLTVALGCTPRSRGADFNAFGATFAAFDSGCPCQLGGSCICQGNCQCSRKGIAKDYDDAVYSGNRFNCPLVAWIGLPPRSIVGAVSYHAPAIVDKRPRVWVGYGSQFEELSGTATVADIEAAAVRVKRSGALAYAAPAFLNCVNGVCR
jgi:hypothetical protein